MAEKRPDYILFDKNTQAIVFGYQQAAIQRMLDFDYVCRRTTPSVACHRRPDPGGQPQVLLGNEGDPHPHLPHHRRSDRRSIPKPTSWSTLPPSARPTPPRKRPWRAETIRTVAIIAEGVPEHRTKELIHIAKAARQVDHRPGHGGRHRRGRIPDRQHRRDRSTTSWRPACTGRAAWAMSPSRAGCRTS